MEYEHPVRIGGDEPVFGTGLLLAGNVNLRDVHRQLSRWTRGGWLYLTQENLKRLLQERTPRG